MRRESTTRRSQETSGSTPGPRSFKRGESLTLPRTTPQTCDGSRQTASSVWRSCCPTSQPEGPPAERGITAAALLPMKQRAYCYGLFGCRKQDGVSGHIGLLENQGTDRWGLQPIVAVRRDSPNLRAARVQPDAWVPPFCRFSAATKEEPNEGQGACDHSRVIVLVPALFATGRMRCSSRLLEVDQCNETSSEPPKGVNVTRRRKPLTSALDAGGFDSRPWRLCWVTPDYARRDEWLHATCAVNPCRPPAVRLFTGADEWNRFRPIGGYFCPAWCCQLGCFSGSRLKGEKR